MEYKIENETIIVSPVGQINSTNADTVEKEIRDCLKDLQKLILDFEKVDYVSSAGLRILLRLKNSVADFRVINVNLDVFNVLDMTGFTKIINVQRICRKIDISNCKKLGEGANGIVYRISPDMIVKVYKNTDCLDEINNEKNLATKAFVLGIPTAISYDIVQAGVYFGSVFELLNADSLQNLLQEHPENINQYVDISINLVKKIHNIETIDPSFPLITEEFDKFARYNKEFLPLEFGEKLVKLTEEIPYDNHLIHGDFHIKNIFVQNDEALLIDMDTLARGNKIFEFAFMYNTYIGFGAYDKIKISGFLNIPNEVAEMFWHKSIETYFKDLKRDEIEAIKDKIRVLAYSKLLYRTLTKGDKTDPKHANEVETFKNELIKYLSKVKSLIL